METSRLSLIIQKAPWPYLYPLKENVCIPYNNMVFGPTLRVSLMRFMENPANILVPVMLFVLLMPGVLFTVPQVAAPVNIPGLNVNNQVLAHAGVFAAVYFTLRTIFPQFYY